MPLETIQSSTKMTLKLLICYKILIFQASSIYKILVHFYRDQIKKFKILSCTYLYLNW